VNQPSDQVCAACAQNRAQRPSLSSRARAAAADKQALSNSAEWDPCTNEVASGTAAPQLAASAAMAEPSSPVLSPLPPPNTPSIRRQTSQQVAASRRDAYTHVHGPYLPKLQQQEEESLFSDATSALAAAPGEYFTHDSHAASSAVLGDTVQHKLATQGILVVWRRPAYIAQIVNRHVDKCTMGQPSSGSGSQGHWCLLRGNRLQASDVKQGRLGNCYALAALFIVAERDRSAAQRLFRSLETSPVGLYQVRLCLGGLWVSVPVDDLLPSHHQHSYLIFANAARGQLWVSLVEKAMASVCLKGYSGLVAGRVAEGLRLLTGAPVLEVFTSTGQTQEEWLQSYSEKKFAPGVHEDTARNDLWVRFLSYSTAGFAMGANCNLHQSGPVHLRPELLHSLISAGLACDHTSSIEAFGLISNHAYSLTRVFEMPQPSSSTFADPWQFQTRFVQIRNPHGSCSYSGPWHFGSPLWTSQLRSDWGVLSADEMKAAGTAILPFEVFLKCFSRIAVAKVRSAQSGWSRVAASVVFPLLQLEHRLHHALTHSTPSAADGAIHELWALSAASCNAVPALHISAHSAGSAELVVSRPPARFAWPAAETSKDPLRLPLQGAHHSNDLAIAMFEGDLSCDPPAPLSQLKLVAASPRSCWMQSICLDAHLESTHTYTAVPLSFAALSVCLFGDAPTYSSSSSSTSPGAATNASSSSALEAAFTSGHAGSNGEPPAACIELHTAAAVLAERSMLSLATLRRATLAVALKLGRTAVQLHASGQIYLQSWDCAEAGNILVAVNSSADQVLSLQLDWGPKLTSTGGSTRNLLCTRGASGTCKDTLLPNTVQLVAAFSMAQAGEGSRDGWSIDYSSKYSLSSVSQVQQRGGALQASMPPVQGTLHEPESLL